WWWAVVSIPAGQLPTPTNYFLLPLNLMRMGLHDTTPLKGGGSMGDEEDVDQRDAETMDDAGETVPEEQAVGQQVVPFMGDELAAAMTAGGSIYITLPGMCAALGLNVKGQMQRIKRTRALAAGLRLIPLKTSGGTQRMNCLRVDRI